MTDTIDPLVERVARAIQQVREQNGAAPYNGFDAIYGRRAAQQMREHLFEEADAAIREIRTHAEIFGRV